MRTHLSVATASIGVFSLLAACCAVHAAEIKVLISSGFVPVMHDLGPKFERATGHKLAVTSGTLGALVKRVQDGEIFNVVVSPRSAIDGFVKDGKAMAGSVTVIANSLMSVAVPLGAPRPDISSLPALKRTLLAAKSIAYPDPDNAAGNAALGAHFNRVLDRLGIADEMKSRTVFSKTLDVGDLIANGQADIGVTQLQNLMRFTGIQIVGPLPGDLQYEVIFAAVVMGGVQDPAASKALVDLLRTPDAAAAIKASGMQPAAP